MLGLVRKLPSWIRQSLVYAGALMAAKVIALLMVPVFTHFLTPEQFATLDILQSLADILSIVIGLGLADTLYRYSGGAATDAERKRHAASILGLAVLTTVFFGVTLQILAPFIQQSLPLETELIDLRIILVSLSFSALILVPLAWLRMENRAWSFFSASAGRTALQALLAAVFLVLGAAITGVLAAGMIACILLAAYAYIIQMRKTGVILSLRENLRYAAYAGPLVLVGLFGFLMGSFDRWIIAAQGDMIETAHYALAAKFGLATSFLLQPFLMWWQPKRFELLNGKDGDQKCAHFAVIGIAIAFLSAVIMASFAPLAVTLLTPAEYHGAIAFIPTLALLMALHSSTMMVNLGIYAGSNTNRAMVIDGIAAALALAGYFILIPMHGAWGAIEATLLALGLRFLETLRQSQKRHPLPLNHARIWAIMGSASLTALLLGRIENPWICAGSGSLIMLAAGLGYWISRRNQSKLGGQQVQEPV
ncbi:lipopolysaccharide biosynthesis protein [Aestuariispira insulae]|uniref:O-antigen/teichoic acid export membrane protein n=1 Tax=Aestuariispira insulae TaxID=1461337 RepID=A0A3D9H2S1_9PROT|nr:oligosaccharide flippase family protein [Aestuariispira insulae]RED43785.1 O-antigen/teichoic acid export membrane protein [Aestuariispira insulae]